jgi:membrane-associated phospholipid phosphatase
MIKQGLKTLYSIGYYGPIILLTALILIIIKTQITNLTTVTNHILYIILMNTFAAELNGVLKNIIKQPRPKKSIKINRQDVRHSKSYGMPSGHAQLVVTNLVYLSLFAKNNIITGISSCIALLTLYQRYVFRMHTLSQLACGSIVGYLIGYIFFRAYLCIFKNDIESTNDQPSNKGN